MQLFKLIILLATLSIFTQSCQFNLSGESVLPDLPPPANHKPQFIKDVRNVKSHKLSEPKVIISKIDTKNSDKITMRVHFIDDGSYFMSGAAATDWIKKWCKGIIITNGVEVPFENMKIRESTIKDRKPLSIALVMDHSGSMGTERAISCQEAALELIKNKKPDDAITIIKYDNNVSLESPLTTSQSLLQSSLKVDGLEGFGGFTAVADAAMKAIDEVSKADATMEKVVIIFTDGYDNSSAYSVDSVIKKASENNVTLCAVDFGYGINEGYMEQYSKGTNGLYHHIYEKDEFKLAFEDIYKKFEYFYVVEFEQPEYGDHKIVLSMCLDNQTISDTVSVNNLPDVGFINLLQVYFDTDKSTIKSESKKAISRVVSMMKLYPGMQIELRGHTDSNNRTGDPEYNKKLSQLRADAVRQALIKEGISESRVISKGFGDSNPIFDNDTMEGRAKNRRTEFVILRR